VLVDVDGGVAGVAAGALAELSLALLSLAFDGFLESVEAAAPGSDLVSDFAPDSGADSEAGSELLGA